MRLYFFLFCFSFGVLLAHSQSSEVRRVIAESPRLFSEIYSPEDSSQNYLLIPMNFNDFRTNQDEQWALTLTGKSVQTIDLVYTDFPKGRDFEALNQSRLERLFDLFPRLFENPKIRWRYVGQTQCKSVSEAQTYFHGFVIHYQAPDAVTLTEVPPPEVATKPSPPPINKTVPPSEEISQLTVYQMLDNEYVTPDSSIYRILNRFPNWQNMALVNDCTGSMYGYNIEVMTWFAQQDRLNSRTKWFTFFNDGDFKPDHKKRIGRTGGVYMIRSQTFADAKKLMLRTMMSGGGGDTPENDMEAVLMTAKNCPDCEHIVLVTDAWSAVRDIRLLKKYIKKYNIPIRVILCGAQRGIAPEYLTMAHLTGGSVHTIEQDLLQLSQTAPEGEIKIGYFVFKLLGKEFVLYKRDIPQGFNNYR